MSLDSYRVVRFTRHRFGGLQVYPRLLDSLGFAHGVAIVVVGLILVLRLCRVRPEGSLGSLGFALVVVGFIRGHWLTSGSSWGYLGLSRVVGFSRDCTVGRWVHPWSLDSLGFALGVVGSSSVVRFTQISLGGEWVHPGPSGPLGFAQGVVGFIRGCWVNSRSALGWLGSSGVVGFSRVRAGGRWVHPGLLGSLRFAQRSLGSSVIVGFTRVRAGSRSVTAASLCSVEFALEVVGLLWGRWVHSGSRWGRLVHLESWRSLWFALSSLGSSGVVGFTRVRDGVVGYIGDRWVHSISRWCRWVHAGSLRSFGCVGSLRLSGFVGFTRVRAASR